MRFIYKIYKLHVILIFGSVFTTFVRQNIGRCSDLVNIPSLNEKHSDGRCSVPIF